MKESSTEVLILQLQRHEVWSDSVNEMLEQIEAMHQNECTFELGDEITYHINQKKAHLTGIQIVHIIIYIYT